MRAFLERYEFRSLLARLERRGDLPAAREATGGGAATGPGGKGKAVRQEAQGADAAGAGGKGAAAGAAGAGEEEGGAAPGQESVASKGYELITSEAALARWVAEAKAAGVAAVDTETDSLDAEQAELVGISLAIPAGPGAPGSSGAAGRAASPEGRIQAAYIPLAHRLHQADLLGAELGEQAPVKGGAPGKGGSGKVEQLSLPQAAGLLSPLLADESVLKVGQNIKYDLRVLARAGMELKGFDDTMLMSYVLEGGGHGMDELAERHLGRTTITWTEATRPPSGRTPLPFAEVDMEKARDYAAEDAEVTLALWGRLRPMLAAEGARVRL